MIKCITNSVNGFYDRYDTNITYLSSDKYPKQSDNVGKWTLIRYKSEYDNITNNRYHIVGSYFPQLTCENSGEQQFFQILRYDLEEPYKVILRNDINEIVVMSVEQFESILDLSTLETELDSFNFLKTTENYVNRFYTKDDKLNFIFHTRTDSLDEFFEEYNLETIHKYSIQDTDILGKLAYIEYYNDLFRLEASDVNGNKVEVYTDENENIVDSDGEMYYKFKSSNVSFIILKKKNISVVGDYFLDLNGNRIVKFLNRSNITNVSYGFELADGSGYTDLFMNDYYPGTAYIRNLTLNDVTPLLRTDVKPLIKEQLMDLYETVDNDHNTVLYDEETGMYYYADNGEVIQEYSEFEKEYKNRFIFSERMRKNMIKCRSTLNGVDDVLVRSFYPYYNVYSKSIVDIPRRDYGFGIIIRADLNSENPQIVVMQNTDAGVRFICQDEAKFFIDTNDWLTYTVDFED